MTIKPLQERAPNPANAKQDDERRRIPMSVPMQKLEGPVIPGYHCHWMRGSKQRIMQAQRAGYEFVSEDELLEYGVLGNMDLGGGGEAGTDLGTRVSVVAGDGFGSDGQAERLYLMKIKEEWWKESQAVLEARNESIAEALRGGAVGSGNKFEKAEDQDKRYGGQQNAAPEPLVGIRKKQAPGHLFTKKH